MINLLRHLIGNMGFRYVFFRATYELKKKTGLLRKQFPTNVSSRVFITKNEWQTQVGNFFFESKATLDVPKIPLHPALEVYRKNFEAGKVLFFDAEWLDVLNWHTNPTTGFEYDASKHWTDIPDFSTTAGDIKYVWEKSRFSFVYPLIRYEHYADVDMAETIFGQIDDWIVQNPVNCGPNWRCSQEITLRVLNWTFALYYYRHHDSLNDQRLNTIMNSIYWQMHHVETNIDFSRIAVRNNHALTETLGLYLIGLLFPFLPNASRWKTKGKKWFEQEIAYQIYDDGTFLQFSMNYHRVAVQLMTWAITLAEKNKEQWNDVVYDRAMKSYKFLTICQDKKTGWLPNYGNNDGALFFKLNDDHFRNYRSQLNALATVLGGEVDDFEDSFWYLGYQTASEVGSQTSTFGYQSQPRIHYSEFKKGGYYTLNEPNTFTFIRCGAYKDRPFQADNLHLDIWHNNKNYFCDAGSYKYNTDEQWVKYFAGTASHNTVMLDDYDQMLKGQRFIWQNWIKKASGQWQETEKTYIFEGEITAFAHVKEGIKHRRRVTKFKNESRWKVEDWLIGDLPERTNMNQIWHTPLELANSISFNSFDDNQARLCEYKTEGWQSELYGQKIETQQLVFSTRRQYIVTFIRIN